MQKTTPVIKTLRRLPQRPEYGVIYHLPPRGIRGDDRNGTKRKRSYDERTDRNDGVLKKDPEQGIVRDCSIAFIGLGGMGSWQFDMWVRCGCGNFHIADVGTFDGSNINRQLGASMKTIGEDKSFATARKVRQIADDYDLYVCPSGLNEATADLLVKGRDVVVDMIEFWALADRIYLHRTCAKHGVVAINCNSIVHASFGTRFDYLEAPSEEMRAGYETVLERMLEMTYERARYLQTQYENGKSTADERIELMEAVMRVFVPEEIEYFLDPKTYSSVKMFRKRLVEEGKAPVISLNPPFAAAWCATETYFEIMRQRSPLTRAIVPVTAFPVMTLVDLGKKEIRTIDLLDLQKARKAQNQTT